MRDKNEAASDGLLKTLSRAVAVCIHARMKPIYKIPGSIFLLMCCFLFSGCDFKTKVSTMVDSIEKKLEEFIGNGVASKTIRNPAGVEAVPEQPDAPKPDVLAENCVTNGMSESEVIAVLGKPNGEVLIRGRRLLVFGRGQVDVTGGFVTNLSGCFIEDVQTSREQSAKWAVFRAQQDAKGFVLYDGNWVTPAERTQMESRKIQMAAAERAGQKAEILRRKAIEEMNRAFVEYDAKGNPIDYSEFVTRGKITIIDFYAIWCKPCRELSPLLDALPRNDHDIILKKVKITSWKSPTAKKYNVTSVPAVLVFDRKGRLVAPPTHVITIIRQYVEDAKRREY